MPSGYLDERLTAGAQVPLEARLPNVVAGRGFWHDKNTRRTQVG